MHLSKRALGMAFGIVWGFGSLLGTWFILIFDVEGSFFDRLHLFFLGYSVSLIGSFIGLLWGYVFGSVVGFTLALIYNITIERIKDQKAM